MILSKIASLLNVRSSYGSVLSLILLSAFFITIGVDHFRNPNFYLNIMPQQWPLKLEAVYVSGFFEILGGVCVIFHQLRKLAGWGLIALLIAVYPANVHMAVNYYLFPDISQTMLYFRLLLQFLFAYWVYRTTISAKMQVTQ